ncbi:MAG: metallophosphoesterase [Myxococcota bacterium]
MIETVGAVVVAGATVARVYRGGTTANDHAVAAVVTGCVAIYPLLWVFAEQAGAASPALGAALAVAASSLYGLFHVLDARRDPGAWIWWARLAQPAYAFSLWTGLLLLLRAPFSWGWPGGWLLLPLGLSLWGTVWTYARSGHLRRHVVPAAVPGPVRLVHLSDLHASPTTPARDLDRIVARANALEPDVVVVTGDLLMPFSEADHDFLLDALARVRAPVFCCPGNHDLPVLDRLRAGLVSRGVTMLVDDVRVVDVRGARIEIAGVSFHWRDAHARLAEAVAALPRPEAHARVLLAHDPRLFRSLDPERFDLVLSGHTHGGQVGTDMFGIGWSILRPLGVLDQGWWRRGRAHLYVHRGSWDTGLPPRMGIASEIAVHELAAVSGRLSAREVR